MNNLFINPKTQSAINVYLSDPTHALLLIGQHGVGLGTLAKALAKEIAGKNVLVLSPTLHKNQKTANINTDDIRSLIKMTNTRRQESIVIVIDEAEKMTLTSPEAFLKALEEPVDNVHFILTSHDTSNLPKTILSRAQIIEVLPTDTKQLISTIKPQLKQRQVEFIAKDLPAEIQRLSDDELYFRSKSRLFEQAKKYLVSETYDKLIIASKLKNREAAIEFLLAVSKLAQIKPLHHKKLSLLNEVINNLAQNGNIKAQLTYLATNW